MRKEKALSLVIAAIAGSIAALILGLTIHKPITASGAVCLGGEALLFLLMMLRILLHPEKGLSNMAETALTVASIVLFAAFFPACYLLQWVPSVIAVLVIYIVTILLFGAMWMIVLCTHNGAERHLQDHQSAVSSVRSAANFLRTYALSPEVSYKIEEIERLLTATPANTIKAGGADQAAWAAKLLAEAAQKTTADEQMQTVDEACRAVMAWHSMTV